MNDAVILQPGKDKAVRRRHHWIFSGAVQSLPDFEDGAILPVRDAAGALLGRMISFDDRPPLEAVEASLRRAVDLRRRVLDSSGDAYRIVNGEGDGLPGLVADRYGDVLVLQISTLGLDRLKSFVVDFLDKLFSPRSILERSSLPTRKEEGLAPAEGCLRGEGIGETEIVENGLRFRVEFVHSQKTGFYLDQRENRSLVRSSAAGRRVLNAFSYTGGFTVAALAGGAAGGASVAL
jgi:23S rRNA (cytosine1962-C5)-methyltransferase